MSAHLREAWGQRVAGEAPANMGGASGQGVGLTTDHQRFFFHMTKRENRESIQASGLEAGRSLRGRGFSDPNFRRIYLSAKPWQPDETHDVWHVDTEGMQLRPDPELPGQWWVSEQDIPSSRLELL